MRGKLMEWFPHVSNNSVKVFGKRSLLGAKGTYEIDCSAEIQFKELRLHFIVECKFWSNRVTQDVVLSLKSKLDDLGAHKGIVVSRGGFQSGAIKVARANGIALWHYSPSPELGLLEIPVAMIDWKAVLSELRASSVKWIRGIRYDRQAWYFYDNNIPRPIRTGTLGTALKILAESFWPIWVVRLFRGRWRHR